MTGPLLRHGLVVLLFGAIASPAIAASAQPCPNEALRSELHSGRLPDCRAYELATPAYKEGTFVNNIFVASEDGKHLIASSLGVFGGSQTGEIPINSPLAGTAFDFSRSESGWTATSLAPPVLTYTTEGMLDASFDASGTLWTLGTLSQTTGVTDLYIERPAGTFVKIGPPTPDPNINNQLKYRYAGGSADLSHVFFSTALGSPALRWPFDKTKSNSHTLYEYAGTGNTQPSLVGVSGGTGSTELVSECGTRLGSSTVEEVSGSMYNAVSATGIRVFVTAVGRDDHECGGEQPPVDEILAREELSPTESRTITVSEPSLSYCAGSPTPPCADANFEGASRDGTRVLFTSTQNLLQGASEDTSGGDSAVKGCAAATGPGGCNLYEDEFSNGGQRLTLASAGSSSAEVQGVARISEDGSQVYFVAKGVLTSAKNALGEEGQAGQDNLYLFERKCTGGGTGCAEPLERTAFVATLAASDAADWQRSDERPVQVSLNDRFLVFSSSADLTGEGTLTGVKQVFRYDAHTGSLIRASIGQNGYNDNGTQPVYGAALAIAALPTYLRFAIDSSFSERDSPIGASTILTPEDGAVFFQSADALTPQALNDRQDTLGHPVPNIYEYRSGTVYLLSDGLDTSTVNSLPGVGLIGSSASGGDVFFATSDSLVGQDTDTQQDIYDARVEGGFPIPLSQLSCSSDACRGALGGDPTLLTPGSATQPPEGSQSTPPAPAKPKQKTKPKRKTKPKHRRKVRKASHRGTGGRTRQR